MLNVDSFKDLGVATSTLSGKIEELAECRRVKEAVEVAFSTAQNAVQQSITIKAQVLECLISFQKINYIGFIFNSIILGLECIEDSFKKEYEKMAKAKEQCDIQAKANVKAGLKYTQMSKEVNAILNCAQELALEEIKNAIAAPIPPTMGSKVYIRFVYDKLLKLNEKYDQLYAATYFMNEVELRTLIMNRYSDLGGKADDITAQMTAQELRLFDVCNPAQLAKLLNQMRGPIKNAIEQQTIAYFKENHQQMDLNTLEAYASLLQHTRVENIGHLNKFFKAIKIDDIQVMHDTLMAMSDDAIKMQARNNYRTWFIDNINIVKLKIALQYVLPCFVNTKQEEGLKGLIVLHAFETFLQPYQKYDNENYTVNFTNIAQLQALQEILVQIQPLLVNLVATEDSSVSKLQTCFNRIAGGNHNSTFRTPELVPFKRIYDQCAKALNLPEMEIENDSDSDGVVASLMQNQLDDEASQELARQLQYQGY